MGVIPSELIDSNTSAEKIESLSQIRLDSDELNRLKVIREVVESSTEPSDGS